MNEKETIAKILGMKTIAVVGISDSPQRPSFAVASYLLEQGYSIIPINPALSIWRGIKAYPDLPAVPVKIDVVDIFRKSEAVPKIVEQAIKARAKAVWMQEGVESAIASEAAEKAGLLVVAGKCMMKESGRLRESLY
jgi:uncharacterized protein